MDKIALDETDLRSHRFVERISPSQIMISVSVVHLAKPYHISEESVSGTGDGAVASANDASVVELMPFQNFPTRRPGIAWRPFDCPGPGPIPKAGRCWHAR